MFDAVRYRIIRGTLTTWRALFDEAAHFASTLRPEELINISHSEDGNDGVIAVWYWIHAEDHAELDSPSPVAPR